MGQMSRTPTGYTLKVTRDTNGPGQTARRESLPEWRAQPVTGICQHTAEADTGCRKLRPSGRQKVTLLILKGKLPKNIF